MITKFTRAEQFFHPQLPASPLQASTTVSETQTKEPATPASLPSVTEIVRTPEANTETRQDENQPQNSKGLVPRWRRNIAGKAKHNAEASGPLATLKAYYAEVSGVVRFTQFGRHL
jgi:hypothetical protein